MFSSVRLLLHLWLHKSIFAQEQDPWYAELWCRKNMGFVSCLVVPSGHTITLKLLNLLDDCLQMSSGIDLSPFFPVIFFLVFTSKRIHAPGWFSPCTLAHFSYFLLTKLLVLKRYLKLRTRPIKLVKIKLKTSL